MLRRIAQTCVRSQPLKQVQRSFTTEAAQDVQAPISVHGVAGKYATALYVSAVKANSLDPVEKEIKAVVEAATAPDSIFGSFIKDPSVSKESRIKAIQAILKDVEISPITKNFLSVLAENGRLNQVAKISAVYEDILMAHRGEVKATITAALELSPSEVDEIKEALTNQLKPNQTLKLEQKVDRSIIGGLLIDIGDKHIDLSVRSKISKMEKLLSEPL